MILVMMRLIILRKKKTNIGKVIKTILIHKGGLQKIMEIASNYSNINHLENILGGYTDHDVIGEQIRKGWNFMSFKNIL
jgi:hypothetical protein